MNSNLVLMFVYELFHSGIKIWVRNENIKLFIPNNTYFSDEQKTFLKLNRDKIFQYLKNIII